MTRRLLVLSTDFGVPVWGTKGASIHLRAMTGAFAEAGAAVALAARRVDGEAADDAPLPARLFALADAPRPEDRGFSPAVMNAHVGRRLDEIAADFPFNAVYERAALWSTAGLEHAARRGIPFFLEVNAPLVAESTRWRALPHPEAAREAEERLAASATRLFPVSSPLAHLLSALGAEPARVVTLGNGVAPAFVRAGRARLEETPRPSGPRVPFTIGFVGSLKPWHGVATILAAFRLLGGAAAGYRLLVVGEGPLGREVDAERAAAPGIERLGAVPHDLVPPLLARIDVALAPYTEVGDGYFSPLKIVEYQAAGVPVVASGGRGVADLVEDGETGLLVPAGDAARLAGAIARLREDRATADLLAIRAHARASRRTWRANADRVLAEWDACGSDAAAPARGAREVAP